MTREELLSEARRAFGGQRVLVTGASGFVGSDLMPLLRDSGCELILPRRADVNLLEQSAVQALMTNAHPQVVIHLAGRVGGILANREAPADFSYENLLMGTVVLHEAWRSGAKKYITLIGGCSYPATASSPISEAALWDGYPQHESAPYSLGKRMAVVLAEAYRRQHGFDAIVLVPGNLYGPHDNFDLTASHVIPALIRKFVEARRAGQDEVVAWGTGRAVRDFVYIEDACEAILLGAVRHTGPDIINISSGVPTSIRDLVETVAAVVGYGGRVVWDAGEPDGQMEKVFDVTRMRSWLRYNPPTSLREGLERTVAWFEALQGTRSDECATVNGAGQ